MSDKDKLSTVTAVTQFQDNKGVLTVAIDFQFLDVLDNGYSKTLSQTVKLILAPGMTRQQVIDSLTNAAKAL